MSNVRKTILSKALKSYDISMAKKPYQTFIGYPFSQPSFDDFTPFEGFNKRSHFSYLKGFKSCLHQKITIYENVVFDVHLYLFIFISWKSQVLL